MVSSVVVPEGEAARGASSVARRALLLALATGVAAWLTALGFYGPTQIALAAPLAGVVVVAGLTSDRRLLGPDLVVTGAVAFLVITIALGSWRLGAVGLGTSLGQLATVALVGRRCATWPLQPARRTMLRDLPALALAVVLAGVVSSMLRWTGLGVVPPSDWDNVLLTAVRTGTWGLAFGAVGLLWATGERPRSLAECRRRGVGVTEMVVAAAVTALAAGIAFSRNGGLPALFPLFLVAAWASLRLSPISATGFATALGGVGVLGTVLGAGAFAQIDDARTAVVAAQSYMLTLVAVTVALALANRDREEALASTNALAHQASERAYERDLVLGSLAEGVVLFDSDGHIVLRNAAGRRMFGRETLPEPDAPPEAAALGLRDLDGSPLAPGYIDALISRSTETPEVLTIRLDTELAPSRVLQVRMQRVSSRTHQTLVVVTFRDVTPEFDRTRELESFAGVLAHDLARPLTVVQGWTEMMVLDSETSEVIPADRVREDGGRILRAATSMRRLLDDLLALTLADQQQLQVQPVDLSALCTDLAADLVGRDGQPARLTVAESLEALVDPTLARQLFDNLLANAAKYVAPGHTPTIAITPGGSVGAWSRILIQDNGIGIPEADHQRIFDDFYRADSHRAAYDGTGIGLAICRRVVDRHDGRIRVLSSSPDRGTLIEVSLPQVPTTMPRRDLVDHPSRQRL